MGCYKIWYNTPDKKQHLQCCSHTQQMQATQNSFETHGLTPATPPVPFPSSQPPLWCPQPIIDLWGDPSVGCLWHPCEGKWPHSQIYLRTATMHIHRMNPQSADLGRCTVALVTFVRFFPTALLSLTPLQRDVVPLAFKSGGEPVM